MLSNVSITSQIHMNNPLHAWLFNLLDMVCMHNSPIITITVISQIIIVIYDKISTFLMKYSF